MGKKQAWKNLDNIFWTEWFSRTFPRVLFRAFTMEFPRVLSRVFSMTLPTAFPRLATGRCWKINCSYMSRLDLYYFLSMCTMALYITTSITMFSIMIPPIQNSIYSPLLLPKSKITWIFKLVNSFFNFYFLTDNFLSLASYYYCITKCKVCFYPIRLVCNIQFS